MMWRCQLIHEESSTLLFLFISIPLLVSLLVYFSLIFLCTFSHVYLC